MPCTRESECVLIQLTCYFLKFFVCRRSGIATTAVSGCVPAGLAKLEDRQTLPHHTAVPLASEFRRCGVWKAGALHGAGDTVWRHLFAPVCGASWASLGGCNVKPEMKTVKVNSLLFMN